MNTDTRTEWDKLLDASLDLGAAAERLEGAASELDAYPGWQAVSRHLAETVRRLRRTIDQNTEPPLIRQTSLVGSLSSEPDGRSP